MPILMTGMTDVMSVAALTSAMISRTVDRKRALSAKTSAIASRKRHAMALRATRVSAWAMTIEP
jgi:hypothetical protein